MLILHHIGCLVDEIAQSVGTYQPIFGKSVSPIYEIASQGVKVCFVEMRDGVFLELVESMGEQSIVHKLRKKGGTFYHLGYWVEEFDQALQKLQEQGFRHINTFYSEAFEGRRCAFLYSPQMELTEIIEK